MIYLRKSNPNFLTRIIVFCVFTAKTSKPKAVEGSSSGKVSVLASQKSSSTPSLPEAMDGNNIKPSFASTEQASSADSLLVSKVAEMMAESVLSNAQSDLTLENVVGGLSSGQDEILPSCSFGASAVALSDLATIVEERNTAGGASAACTSSSKANPTGASSSDVTETGDDDAFVPLMVKMSEIPVSEGIPTPRSKLVS